MVLGGLGWSAEAVVEYSHLDDVRNQVGQHFVEDVGEVGEVGEAYATEGACISPSSGGTHRAKVGEFEDNILRVWIPEQKNVLGLHVSVDEAVRVAGLERTKQLAPEPPRPGLGEGAIAVQALQQVAASPLHDEPVCAWLEGGQLGCGQKAANGCSLGAAYRAQPVCRVGSNTL